MAFDFLGTFNKSQFDRFIAFAQSQLADVGGRVAHLNYEKKRLGSLTFEYGGGGIPTSFTVTSATGTYIGGLIAAYEALGGNVLFDLQVRSRPQAVHLLAGTETQPAQFMSNGDVVGGKGLADGTTAVLVNRARSWMQSPLHYRREYLERKVRRALDYAEQLDDEIAALAVAVGPAIEKYSLAWVAGQVAELLQDTNYRAVFDDKGQDPHGKTTYAPFLPYSKADSQLAQVEPGVAGRDNEGYMYPGATGGGEGEGTA